jgi:hypothetical protein
MKAKILLRTSRTRETFPGAAVPNQWCARFSVVAWWVLPDHSMARVKHFVGRLSRTSRALGLVWWMLADHSMAIIVLWISSEMFEAVAVW